MRGAGKAGRKRRCAYYTIFSGRFKRSKREKGFVRPFLCGIICGKHKPGGENVTQTCVTNNEKETEALGEAIARRSEKLAAIALAGDLGAGKTALVRGLARWLGSADAVTSPTYAIVNEYRGSRKICHFDLYRLSGGDALWEIGWEDYLASGALCVAEWSTVAPEMFPPETLWVEIEKTGEEQRKITLRWPEGVEAC